MTAGSADAWRRYWRQAHSCTPDAGSPVAAFLAGHWAAFADSLPRDAHILDAACGSGAVMRHIHARRPDCRLIGVDFAHDGGSFAFGRIEQGDIRTIAAGPERFDAVVSQFGIEYAGLDAWRATAVALRPGAMLHAVAHHRSSPIVGHNRARAAAMRAFRDSGLFAMARGAAAGVEQPGVDPALRALAAAHSGQSVIRDMFGGLRNALALSAEAARQAAIADVEGRATFELERLDALDAAALAESDAQAVAMCLTHAGVDASAAPLMLNDGAAVAWLVTGNRAA